jgi:hypothetical protein
MDNKPLRDDDQKALDRALEKQKPDNLVGDMEENRNLSGSTTWETLGEEDEENPKRDTSPKTSPKEQTQNPPWTTTGPITSPKFGAAGSGGAEFEPGPEED